MVQVISTSYTYNFDFLTATVAYLNKYPNPYAKHVLSSDTIENYVDSEGRLRTTRLVVKTGLLPDFIKPLLGKSLDSWIIEKSVIDPKDQTMLVYTSNVDHRRFVKVEELLKYHCDGTTTSLGVNVKISSNLFGFKQKIEQWSRDKFRLNMQNSRQGLMYVMTKFHARMSGLT